MRDEIIKMARNCGAEDFSNEVWLLSFENLERFFHMAQAAALEKVKTLTNEQIEKVIKDNMMFSMNLAGMRVDLVELIES
jgi:hypothetical protein